MNKKQQFSDFALNLFKNKYQNILTDKSIDLYNEYTNECIKKADELGLDTDELSYDGECLYLEEAGLDYNTSKKTIWWDYNDKQIIFYSWI